MPSISSSTPWRGKKEMGRITLFNFQTAPEPLSLHISNFHNLSNILAEYFVKLCCKFGYIPTANVKMTQQSVETTPKQLKRQKSSPNPN
jgi:hypothetical protein